MLATKSGHQIWSTNKGCHYDKSCNFLATVALFPSGLPGRRNDGIQRTSPQRTFQICRGIPSGRARFASIRGATARQRQMKDVDLHRCFAAETLGTAFLLAAVVGSGIMGERLAGGNLAIVLLAN